MNPIVSGGRAAEVVCVDLRFKDAVNSSWFDAKFTHDARVPGNVVHAFGDPQGAAVTRLLKMLLKIESPFIGTLFITGHSDCALVREAVENEKLGPDKIEPWDRPVLEARKLDGTVKRGPSLSDLDYLSQLNSFRSYQTLLTYPMVQQLVEAGRLGVYATWHHLASAATFVLDSSKIEFVDPAILTIAPGAFAV